MQKKKKNSCKYQSNKHYAVSLAIAYAGKHVFMEVFLLVVVPQTIHILSSSSLPPLRARTQSSFSTAQITTIHYWYEPLTRLCRLCTPTGLYASYHYQ